MLFVSPRSFGHSMSSLKLGAPWTTRLSSAGLVFFHFGHRIIAQMTGLQSEQNSQTLDLIFDKLYENFIEEVDANDNGIDVAAQPRLANKKLTFG